MTIKADTKSINKQATTDVATLATASDQLTEVQAKRDADLSVLREKYMMARSEINDTAKAEIKSITEPAREAASRLQSWVDVGVLDAEVMPDFSLVGVRSAKPKATIQTFMAQNPEVKMTGKEIEDGTGLTGTNQCLQGLSRSKGDMPSFLLKSKLIKGGRENVYVLNPEFPLEGILSQD